MKEMLDVPSSKENQVTLGDARDSELTSSYRITLASHVLEPTWLAFFMSTVRVSQLLFQSKSPPGLRILASEEKGQISSRFNRYRIKFTLIPARNLL